MISRSGTIALWALAALASLTSTACVFGADNVAGPCSGNMACDDGNACTDDVCAADGYCDHPASQKVPDDGNDCTEDSCDGTSEIHAPKVDLTACGEGGMLKCEAGQCKCSEDAQCGASDLCATRTCDSTGSCQTDFADMGTLVDPAEEKDCKKNVCDGQGAVVLAADPLDPPDDPTDGDCKKTVCDADGNKVEGIDDTDVPAPGAGGESCTLKKCVEGVITDDTTTQNGQLCGQPTCTGGGNNYQYTPAPKCQDGACLPSPSEPCGNYACNQNNDGCATGCFMGLGCTDDAYCTNSFECADKLPNGSACDKDSACVSGACSPFGNVCCNDKCFYYCYSCDGAHTGQPDGQCKPVKAKIDPFNDCMGTCDSNTGNNCCNGNGGCN